MTKKKTDNRYSYEFLVHKVPYHVEVSPFLYNDEKRFLITINGNDHVYAWDEAAVQLRALDDEAATIPDELEKEISDALVKTVIL